MILAHTTCLASGEPAAAQPLCTPLTVNVSLPVLPHCRHPESGLEPPQRSWK